MERKHNIMSWHPVFNEKICHSLFSAVVLDPDFLVMDTRVDNWCEYPLLAFPSNIEQLVLVVGCITYHNYFDITISGTILRFLLKKMT